MILRRDMPLVFSKTALSYLFIYRYITLVVVCYRMSEIVVPVGCITWTR